MAKKAKARIFWGAFIKRADAVARQKKHPGSKIVKRKVKGRTRHAVEEEC